MSVSLEQGRKINAAREEADMLKFREQMQKDEPVTNRFLKKEVKTLQKQLAVQEHRQRDFEQATTVALEKLSQKCNEWVSVLEQCNVNFSDLTVNLGETSERICNNINWLKLHVDALE